MSVYNGERFLEAAIDSVLAQSFADFEFLILDDGSSDATPHILKAYATRDARIRPIIRENRGLVASLNQLLAEARAPLVARMDADDICLPQRLERQIAFLAGNPDYGVIGAQTYDIDEEANPWPVPSPDNPESHEAFLAAIETDAPLICHPAVMYRRAVVLEVGAYHAAFRHCEDLDLWLRLSGRTRLCSLPDRLIRYRRSPNQVSSRHATEQQIGAAVARLAWRERSARRPDPTEHLTRLPDIDGLDALFGRVGVGREVRAKVAPTLIYAPSAMRDDGFELLLRYLREGGSHQGMWRTVARLVRFGEPRRAARLAATLTRGRDA